MTKLQTVKFQELVPKLREKGFYDAQEPRKISWPEYNLNQIYELKDALVFIRDSVNRCAAPNIFGKVGRPLTDPKILAKAILLCERFDLPERQAQGWLEIIGPFLGIFEPLDDRVIGEAYGRPEVVCILKQVFETAKTSDGVLAGDGTGLETSRKQNYESKTATNGYMTSIVDSREIVQAFDISGEQECRAMHSLVKRVSGDSIRFDAGFNDRELVKLCTSLSMRSYVFPKKSNVLNAKGNYGWTDMYLELLHRVQEWLQEYHQRSHTESFHSSFKRVFGIMRKINPLAQLSQITARIILHNRKRQTYFDKLSEN